MHFFEDWINLFHVDTAFEYFLTGIAGSLTGLNSTPYWISV